MPPEFESRLRTIKFAQYLTKKGYDVTIFASSVMHNMNINLIKDNSDYIERTYENIKFVHIKTLDYKNNGISRVFSSYQFALKLIKISSLFKKPDVIIQTATVPFGNVLYYLSKKNHAKYIVEVLDLWPESFVDLNILSRKNPLLILAYKAEKWLYKRADYLVFSMEGGRNYIIDKKWDKDNNGTIDLKKVHYINNGVDLEDFDYNVKHSVIEDLDLNDKSTRKVIYIGSIRLANNLMYLVKAAEHLQSYTDIKFLLFGDGSDREYLENYCLEHKINNVIFKHKWIEPKYVPYLLSCSTVNILNYKPGCFGKYGGSQSKMFQYMASGKPICSNIDMMYCPVKRYGIGIAKEFPNTQEYANAILSLVEMEKTEYDKMCSRARKSAENFDYKFLVDKLETLINT